MADPKSRWLSDNPFQFQSFDQYSARKTRNNKEPNMARLQTRYDERRASAEENYNRRLQQENEWRAENPNGTWREYNNAKRSKFAGESSTARKIAQSRAGRDIADYQAGRTDRDAFEGYGGLAGALRMTQFDPEAKWDPRDPSTWTSQATPGGGGIAAATGVPALRPYDDDPTRIVNDITSQDSELMRAAAQRGRESANARGMLNSSIGIQAAQQSIVDAALPLAESKANIEAQHNRDYTGFYYSSQRAAQDQQYALQRDSLLHSFDLESRQQDFENTLALNEQGHEFEKTYITMRGQEQRELSQQEFEQASALTDAEFEQEFRMSREAYSQRLQEQSDDRQFRLDFMQAEFANAKELTDLEFQQEWGMTKFEWQERMNQLETQIAADLSLSEQEFGFRSSLSRQEFQQQLGLNDQQFQQELDLSLERYRQELGLTEINQQFESSEADKDRKLSEFLQRDSQDFELSLQDADNVFKLALTDKDFQNSLTLQERENAQELAVLDARLQADLELSDADFENRWALTKEEARNDLELQSRDFAHAIKERQVENDFRLTLSEKDYQQALGLSKREFEYAQSLSDQEFEQEYDISREHFRQRMSEKQADFDFEEARQERSFQMEQSLENIRFMNDRELAELDRDTRIDLMEMETSMRIAVEEMQFDAQTKGQVSDIAVGFQELYSSNVRTILDNPDIPSDERNALLQDFGAMLDDQIVLLEDLYSVDLNWEEGTWSPFAVSETETDEASEEGVTEPVADLTTDR